MVIKFRKIILRTVCILVNLLMGNLALALVTSLSYLWVNVLVSLFAVAVYIFAFEYMQETKTSRTKKIFTALLCSLSIMVVACICVSIAMRLSSDSIVTAAIKGIIPMSVFAFVFTSPVWLLASVLNYFSFSQLSKK